jgi:hypothetical protein
MKGKNPTRRGDIPKQGCLCGYSRKKKRYITNGCPLHKVAKSKYIGDGSGCDWGEDN